ncbi:16S rRNA (uracil1498-N3)-methyltransferase [Formosa sp. Hel1_31_208]|uniref:16S rRNA (uracil(1498)-N(3))-methyltransferase n=1 Tax=Formosa sp. Hel1_31_208 TaxID=1798225 RepID=UPI0008796264|nr:16S rRNA (uracil(1498)-N(3))-methyltransferase [Formosa sp. Hel1_31_208]SDS32753.1 16S rRNA (uracil1498-N3)-methyltransferase [Formosa sp. Hel1_31_208]
MQLFYNQDLTSEDSEIRFTKEESRHIVKVLRKSVGDILHITNGKGELFSAEITLADIKNCSAVIKTSEFQEQKKYHLHLAVAPTKMNDRYEWFLEKATEIGIDEITPVFCDNSERRTIKAERYEKILQSAMKQSLNTFLPKLNEAVPFKAFVEQEFHGQTFIAHCEDMDRSSLKSLLKPKESVTILIGPEGDFSTQEISLALQHQFKPVTLGDTRLRTETAAIVACHSVAYTNNV